MPEPSPSWMIVFRYGILPSLSTNALRFLQHCLATNDKRLIQKETTQPQKPDEPCSHACLLALPVWLKHPAPTVAEAEDYFHWLCCETDNKIGEPASTRYFLNWFDDTPREEMRAKLLPIVNETINDRA